MSEGKPCKGYCDGVIEEARAMHNQTKYCIKCAKLKKRENSEEARTYQDRKDYLREYMREYRQKNRVLELLSNIETLVIKFTSVAGTVLMCVYILWHHISQLLNK